MVTININKMDMCKWMMSMVGLLMSLTVSAKVVLLSLFSNNMVLQQKAEVPVWGKAPSKAQIMVIPSSPFQTLH